MCVCVCWWVHTHTYTHTHTENFVSHLFLSSTEIYFSGLNRTCIIGKKVGFYKFYMIFRTFSLKINTTLKNRNIIQIIHVLADCWLK